MKGDPWFGGSPSGTAEAAAAVDYVRSAIAELETLHWELSKLTDLGWRSQAADEFSSFLEQCIGRVGQTLYEFEISAEALRRYEDELRMLSQGDG